MINIVAAENAEFEEYSSIIFETDLGNKYYPTKQTIYKQLEEGLERGDKIYVAKDYDNCLKGIVWYQQKGIFHEFPYLHMIAVKNDCQRQGIGKKLLDFFEYDVLKSGYNHLRTKVFLTVGDFNVNAERLYINRGYVLVGEIEGLYRKRVTDKLYMKIVTASEFAEQQHNG